MRLDDEVMEPPKQKTLVAKLVENPHHVERMARSVHCTSKSNEIRREDLED